MFERPKSVIRAFPDSSTTIFGCTVSRQKVMQVTNNDTHPFQISMYNPTKVKMRKSLCDAE